MDMAGTMKNIATTLFPKARQVVDRFHVMKNVLEDMNALISKQKTEIKKSYLEEQDRARIERRKPSHQKYAGGETLLEIITRGRFQFVQRRSEWNLNQITRGECFERIPQLQEIAAMYQKVERVFEIYDNSLLSPEEAKAQFNAWFIDISKLSFITELQNTGRMIQHHLDRIVNYFHTRLTNGYAE